MSQACRRANEKASRARSHENQTNNHPTNPIVAMSRAKRSKLSMVACLRTYHTGEILYRYHLVVNTTGQE